MKKALSLFSIIAVAGLCMMFTSCSNDDTEEAMVLSGQWQGDFGMYYGYTYPDGFYDEFDSYDTDLIFYPDYDYATHGYGYQVDWYSNVPNANGNVSPYSRLSYRFNWSVVNGRINLTYPGYPEYNTTIRDYRLNNNHFTGYFGNTDSYFDLIKIADYYSWYDYDYLYRTNHYTYIEWGWDGGYYYNGVYYDYGYAKTRKAEDTNKASVEKPAQGGRVTKIGNRFAEK
ncbi:MAG: hypothetical protein Q4D25_04660 [Bacteroidales bacterium]|jgi:hypothetical protein|nr:hypothetical protein [Bacteroidaceae bacterium]MDO4201404.1 hypothetical protein [Bacteroidales bacterium]